MSFLNCVSRLDSATPIRIPKTSFETIRRKAGLAKRAALSASISVGVVAASLSSAQAAIPAPIVSAAAQSVSTTVFFDQLYQFATRTIGDARNAGDFLAVRAGGQALLVLDQFKQVYEKEMGLTLKALDRTAYAQLSRVQASLDKLHQDFKTARSVATDLEAVGLEMASKIDPQSNRSFVTAYTPKVFKPGQVSPYIVRVSGVALDQSNPRLLSGKSSIAGKIVGHNTVEFTIPSAMFQNPLSAAQNLDFKIEYNTVAGGWFNRLMGRKKAIQGSVILAVMPAEPFSYSYTSRVTVDRRTEQYPGNHGQSPIWLPQFRGVNADIPQALQATPGWSIDLHTVNFVQGDGGGESSCTGLAGNEQNEKAPAFWAHVGRIGQQGLSSPRPGYVNCGVWYTEYQIDSNYVVDGPNASRSNFGWSEVAMPKPDRLIDLTVSVWTFESPSPSTFTASDASHDLYEVRFEPSRVVVLPKLPDDYIR